MENKYNMTQSDNILMAKRLLVDVVYIIDYRQQKCCLLISKKSNKIEICILKY